MANTLRYKHKFIKKIPRK